MGKIRWFFLRMSLGACLIVSAVMAPARAEVSPYMVARHPISEPSGAKYLCKTYAWACAVTSGTSDFGAKEFKMMRKLNTRINRQVRQIEDATQYARSEVWALPTKRGGDCEDFALLKKRELLNLGVSADRLMIAMVLDKKMRAHAVLVVRTHKGDMVLDNLTSKVVSWDKTGYMFLKMQNPNKPGKWDSIFAGGRLLKIQSRG